MRHHESVFFNFLNHILCRLAGGMRVSDSNFSMSGEFIVKNNVAGDVGGEKVIVVVRRHRLRLGHHCTRFSVITSLNQAFSSAVTVRCRLDSGDRAPSLRSSMSSWFVLPHSHPSLDCTRLDID